MVSTRCKMVVKEVLKKLGLHFIIVDLGEAELMENLSSEERALLAIELENAGFELMDDKRTLLIRKIKKVIIDMVQENSERSKKNVSDYLSTELQQPYAYLSTLFSELQGITIEQFIITQKVERIKELIIYDELNITEIAWEMNYSSVAHLSNQFKKVTGLSPSHFRKLKDKRDIMPEEF